MGFYHEQRPGPEPDANPGCLDVLVITRVVLGILFLPIAAIVLVIMDIGVIFYAFSIHSALALIPIAVTVAAIWAFARWDRNRDRPPDSDELPPPRIM